jgi:DHA1 family tetracycline resistance protein-like MFS transporter
VSPDAQGELQGAVASLFSLSAIIGPPLLTHLFSRFSAPESSPYVPGAAFFAATILAFGSLFVFWLSTREPVPEESASVSDSGLSAA